MKLYKIYNLMKIDKPNCRVKHPPPPPASGSGAADDRMALSMRIGRFIAHALEYAGVVSDLPQAVDRRLRLITVLLAVRSPCPLPA